MVAMVSKIKAITGQLNIKGKFLGSMPSCSTEVPYISNTLTLPPPPQATNNSAVRSLRGAVPEAAANIQVPEIIIPGIDAPGSA